MSKSIVSIVKGDNAKKMVEEALNHLGGIKALIKEGSTVVIKPNGGHEGAPESSVCTSPAVVKAVIEVIRQANPKKIILAEAAAIGCDTMKCLEVSGIKNAAEEAGIDEIIDIKSDTDLVRKRIQNPGSKIKNVKLPRFLIEADHIINVPIFKTHVSMVFTCALKNIKGVVQDTVHGLMHMTNLAAAMMDLWSVIRADLSIADLIRPMEGFGPHTTGTPVDFGCIVASKDPVALDATVCRMIGLAIDDVDYFTAAREKGIGLIDESDIEIRGNTIKEVYKKLYLPYLDGFGAWPEYNFHIENACSSCQGLLAYSMAKLKLLDEYDKNKGIDIVLGRKRDILENIKYGKDLLLIGDCTKTLKKKIEAAGKTCVHVNGCPPGEPHPYWAITDRIDMPDQRTPEQIRIRHEAENDILIERLKAQKSK